MAMVAAAPALDAPTAVDPAVAVVDSRMSSFSIDATANEAGPETIGLAIEGGGEMRAVVEAESGAVQLFSAEGREVLPASGGDARPVVFEIPGGVHTLQVRSLRDAVEPVVVSLLDRAAPGDRARSIGLSRRGVVSGGGDSLSLGFSIEGTEPLSLLVRAVGPALGDLGGPATVGDPVLTFCRNEVPLAINDDWSESSAPDKIVAASVKLGLLPLAAGSRDAAMIVTVPPGDYTAAASAKGSVPGNVLLEIFELHR